MNTLKIFFIAVLLIFNTGLSAEESKTTAKPVEISVYRSPTCSCCGKWIDHLKQNNFNVKDIVTENMEAIKEKYGVPKEMASCHTALVDGYVVEGHVPAKDIYKMLTDKPKVIGLAVPGMVTGSPGMEMGDAKPPYDVMSFDKEKHFEIYNSYNKGDQ